MNALSVFKRSKDPFAKAEAELADRQRRRDMLAAKLAVAQLDSEQASAERRRLLIEVDAPQQRRSQLPKARVETLRIASQDSKMQSAPSHRRLTMLNNL